MLRRVFVGTASPGWWMLAAATKEALAVEWTAAAAEAAPLRLSWATSGIPKDSGLHSTRLRSELKPALSSCTESAWQLTPCPGLRQTQSFLPVLWWSTWLCTHSQGNSTTTSPGAQVAASSCRHSYWDQSRRALGPLGAAGLRAGLGAEPC